MKQQQLALQLQLQHKAQHPEVTRGTSAGNGASAASVASEDAKAMWMTTITCKDGRRAGLLRAHPQGMAIALYSRVANYLHKMNLKRTEHEKDFKKDFIASFDGEQYRLRAERQIPGQEGEGEAGRHLRQAAVVTGTVDRADSFIRFLPRPHRTLCGFFLWCMIWALNLEAVSASVFPKHFPSVQTTTSQQDRQHMGGKGRTCRTSTPAVLQTCSLSSGGGGLGRFPHRVPTAEPPPQHHHQHQHD